MNTTVASIAYWIHLLREGFHNKFDSCLQQNTTYVCYENDFSDRERK